MGSNEQPPGFRPDIEGLRGIAVLMVVLFHCGLPGLSGGFVGVDVFFVLSGYLITGILVNEIIKTSKLSPVQFYSRRVRRLLPASALTLLVTLLVGAFIQSPHELDNTGHAARATALYMSNIFFDKNAGDYFAMDVRTNPLLHTWSLAVEEQFYLFWPLMILLGLRICRSMKALVIVLAALTLISLGTSVYYTEKVGTFAFYELPARAWEFGMGGLAVLLPRGKLKIPFRWWVAFGWVGIILILTSAHLILGDTHFPGWIALIPVIGTVTVLVAGTEYPCSGIGILLCSKPLQVLGRLSYSWYLWHWPFLVFSTSLLPNISFTGKATAAIASLALAAVTYHLIENPIRFNPSLIKHPGLSVLMAIIITTFLFGAALLSMWFASQMANEPRMKAINSAINDVTRLPRSQCVSDWQSPEVKTCDFGAASARITIVLFGDSHAIQWFNPLQRIVESNGWKLVTMVKSACGAFDITRGVRAAAACSRWRTDAISKIIALHPSVVFLGNSTSILGAEDNQGVLPSLDELRVATRRTLGVLTQANLSVAIMRDNPFFAYDVPTCLARSARHSWYPGGSCEADKSTVLNAAVFESEKAGARDLSNVHFIDITDRLCHMDICWAVQEDTVIYRDNHHLTGSFTDKLAPLLEGELLTILNAPR
jgi:peptidoglycan/LPS O-acetylase OafA/YrhL